MRTGVRQWLRREEGSIIPLIALSLTVIMGFAALTVDMGAMYLERERAQHGADAAALAAVQELPDTPDLARSVAYDYAERNGFANGDVQVALSNGDSRVKVTITHRVELFFARILGITSGTVAASATAQTGSVSTYTGIAPFGVQEQPFIVGAQYQLKAAPQSTAPPPYTGNFAALALGANGSPTYEDTIKFGYKAPIHVGDVLTTEPGDMSGPTADGISYRLTQMPPDTYCSYDQAHLGCAEVLIVPIVSDYLGTGKTTVTVVGFAAFYLDGTVGGGSDEEVVGRFLNMVIDADVGTGASFGLDANQLVG